MQYTTAAGKPFSEDQTDAVDTLRDFDGRSIILTGAAGAGKSEVIKYLLRAAPQDYMVCSTTGRSALLIGGRTVDTIFCFNRSDWEIWSTSYLKRVMHDIPDNIIIDEASMIGENMAAVIREVAEKYKKTIILVGDWAQARPVNEEWPFHDELFDQAEVIKLTENHRQHAGEYLDALNEVRRGAFGEKALKLVNRVRSADEVDERAVRIYPTNSKVYEYNRKKLKEHCQESGELGFGCVCRVVDYTGKLKDNPDKSAKLVKNSNLAHQTSFAVGCRAMIVRNSTADCPHFFVNGDTGVILDAVYPGNVHWNVLDEDEKKAVWKCNPHYIRMKLDRGPIVSVPTIIVKDQDALGRVRHEIHGIPITLGYAFTVHKTQGMTIPEVFANVEAISSFTDLHGLAYVAMSRTPELSGLYLDMTPKDVVYCDPEVLPLV